jgi:hypothetical protein
MHATDYKSPPARLARLFCRSRDTWKRRAALKQARIKKMRITVRDLTASRDHWKARAQQQAAELAALRSQPGPPPSQPLILQGEA